MASSEVAAFAVGKATGVDYRAVAPKTRRKAIASIDITPAEFFDEKHAGKYFVISPLEFEKQK